MDDADTKLETRNEPVYADGRRPGSPVMLWSFTQFRLQARIADNGYPYRNLIGAAPTGIISTSYFPVSEQDD